MSNSTVTTQKKKRQKTLNDLPVKDIGFRYIPVELFTPLNNPNWLSLSEIKSVNIDNSNWKVQIVAGIFDRQSNQSTGQEGFLWIELVSFYNNIFRIRFQPGWDNSPLINKVAGPVTQAELDNMKKTETQIGIPKTLFNLSTDHTLKFETKDLAIEVSNRLILTITRKVDNQVIFQSTADSNGNSLLATYVNMEYGNALATAWVNNKDNQAKERFYGQGEVNVLEGTKTVKDGGYYVVGKTGLAMTNFNYDQITYEHPELYPETNREVLPPSVPNYYYPMYFSAPWIMGVGNQGKTNQYAYGIFLDNPSQTYTNTGDTLWSPGVGNGNVAYMGAQYGELDCYFIFGEGGKQNQPIENVVCGLSYLTANSTEKNTTRAAMPPKYIFGYFQGVYGAVGVTNGSIPKDVKQKVDNYIAFETIVDKYQSNNVPLEGLAVDVDVQEIFRVFTTNNRFWTKGGINKGMSIFDWAHKKGLVTQTNITCFVRNDSMDYNVYKELKLNKDYTQNKGADDIAFVTNDDNPDAYCGQLQYGEYAKVTAIFPDFGKQKTVKWWGGQYKSLYDLGLDFVWQDMTTPSMDTHILKNPVTDDSWNLDEIESGDASYARSFNWRSYHPQAYLTDLRYAGEQKRTFAQIRNQHAFSLCSATYNNAVKKLDKRSYIIARGGQIGSQHFGGLWMGDNNSTWTDLNIMVPMIINMNMSGVSVVGADIGGFAQNVGTTPVDGQLITRWVQAGCLLPWFRNHYDRWLSYDPSTSENMNDWKPKGHGKMYQELYHYTEGIGNGKTYLDVMKSAIELRYRWQEVLYTASWINSTQGLPMIKGMNMWDLDPNIDFGARPELNSQFLLGGTDGKQILVAPILTENQTDRAIYFPLGANWFPYYLDGDISNLNKYQKGGISENVYASIDNLPVYVREGAVLPTRYSTEGNKSINTYTWDDPLVMDVFGAVEGSKGMIYIDDGGATTSAENDGNYTTLMLEQKSVSDKGTSLELSIDKANYNWSINMYVRLRCIGTVTNVVMNSKKVTKSTAKNREEFFAQTQKTKDATAKYWIDKATGSVWIAFDYSNKSEKATIKITCSNAINVATSM